MAMYANGQQISGCTSYASAVNYIEEDGSKSTVQDKISELSSNLPFKLGIDENGNYGYIKEGADSVIPFKLGNLQFTQVCYTTSYYYKYTFDSDGYYLGCCAGTKESNQADSISLSTSCEYTMISSNNSMMALYLLKGKKGATMQLTSGGGGVSVKCIRIFKIDVA